MSAVQEENRWDTNARQIHCTAANWVERCESATWDETEQAAFDSWLTQSPAHMVAYLRAKDVWQRADRLRALGTATRRTRLLSLPALSSIIRGAAVFVVVAIIGAAAVGYFLPPTQKSYATAVGGRETVTLLDGSRIDLNTDTAVRVSEDGDRRTVWLDRGEAFFQIKHDPARPFVVAAGNRRVTDLGTKFLVRSGPRFEVALVEGRAWFESADAKGRTQSALLTPGDVAVATNDSITMAVKVPGVLMNELGWRRGVLVFDRTTLGEAAADFNRYNRQKLIVADSSLAKKPIDGTFHINDVEAFLDVVQDLMGLHIDRHSDEVIISR